MTICGASAVENCYGERVASNRFQPPQSPSGNSRQMLQFADIREAAAETNSGAAGAGSSESDNVCYVNLRHGNARETARIQRGLERALSGAPQPRRKRPVRQTHLNRPIRGMPLELALAAAHRH